VAWIVGIDEAGYGPNLGPFVMTSVACRVPDDTTQSDLWDLLHPAVRRADANRDDRLLVADSKVVYSSARGLAGLERGTLAIVRPQCAEPHALCDLIEHLAADDHPELRKELWYRGKEALPARISGADLGADRERLDRACRAAGVSGWRAQSVLVCPAKFNALTDAAGSKGAVLAHGLARLVRDCHLGLPAEGPILFFVDKHGGRNAYAALLQHALPDGAVVARQEGLACSVYEVVGTGRLVRLTFQPRAEAACLCVALASMVSKYLRELLMQELNSFWQQQVPGLKATAGYPVDAARFWQAIRPAAERLGATEAAIWRRK
jgi:hypothetical protein